MTTPERFPQEFPKPETKPSRKTEVVPLPVEWRGPGLMEGKDREAAVLRLDYLDRRIRDLIVEIDILEGGSFERLTLKEGEGEGEGEKSFSERAKEKSLNILRRIMRRRVLPSEITIEGLDSETRRKIGEELQKDRRELEGLLEERDDSLSKLYEGQQLEEHRRLQEKFVRRRAKGKNPQVKKKDEGEILVPGEAKSEGAREYSLEELEGQFEDQVQRFVDLGFPKAAGISEEAFRSRLEPLREKLEELVGREFPAGHIPFIVVPREKLLALEKEIPLMEVYGKKGFTTLNLSELKTADGVEIPESLAYLALDVENGKAMLGRIPDEAVKQFKKEGRSPLTAEEGVAIILQHPEILKDHYMDLPGSRHDDGKVASLWLSGGEPKLRWSWAGYSGAWGSASCGEDRIGA